MAIDTEAKRKSMLKFSGTTAASLVFLPGGGIPAGDRATLLYTYEGNALGAAAAVTAINTNIARPIAMAIVKLVAPEVTNIPKVSSTGGASSTFSVLNSSGATKTPGLSVLDSDGNAFTVTKTVLDSDGNSFGVS